MTVRMTHSSTTSPRRRPARPDRPRAGTSRGAFPALLCAALAAGCATVQPPSGAPVDDVDVADVQRAPPAVPATVRWGGTIVRMANVGDGATELEVVARPLGGNGRPRHVDASAGRFVARVERFLDPEIVREGRDVTVTGTVGELREGRVGESAYRFPVVAVENLRYWTPAAPGRQVQGPYGPYPAYGPYGYAYGAPYGYAYDPFAFERRFWHDFWHDPVRRPVGRPRGGRTATGVTVRP